MVFLKHPATEKSVECHASICSIQNCNARIQLPREADEYPFFQRFAFGIRRSSSSGPPPVKMNNCWNLELRKNHVARTIDGFTEAQGGK